MSGGGVFRRAAEFLNLEKNREKKSAGAASLRGQGTPAYPARLRSERARNWSNHFLPQVQETTQEYFPPQRQKIIQGFLLPQGLESVAISACRFLPPQQIGRL